MDSLFCLLANLSRKGEVEQDMKTREAILLVDDDINVCEVLKLYLEKEDYSVVCCYDGQEAIREFGKDSYALIILDIMIPELNGWEVCKYIRNKSQVPIFLLTASGDFHNKALGFQLGIDEYIVKPFDPREIVFRVQAMLRRINSEEQKVLLPLKIEGLTIDPANYLICFRDKDISLSPKEMDMLYLMATNINKVFTRIELMEKIWGFENSCLTRTVDVHINRLRAKLKGVDKVEIKTVWTIGYKLEVAK